MSGVMLRLALCLLLRVLGVCTIEFGGELSCESTGMDRGDYDKYHKHFRVARGLASKTHIRSEQ